MLTVSYPAAYSNLPNESFEVSGTCSSNHQITVKLTMTTTSQFHNYYAQASQGGWSTTVTPWGEGLYQLTVTCEGLNDSTSVELTVGTPIPSTDPPAGP